MPAQKFEASQNVIEKVLMVQREPGFCLVGSRDKSISCWNFLQGQIRFCFNARDEWVKDIIFLSGEETVASLAEDKRIVFWDFATQKVLAKQEQMHKRFPTCMVLWEESGVLVSGSLDREVRVWRIE